MQYDYINEQIIWFCTNLFHLWLDDYRWVCKKYQEDSGIYNKFSLNEGMEKNITDLCLPIDFFVEKIFQVGLVSQMRSVKMMIEIMLQFDNVGWTDQGPKTEITRTPPPEHHVAGLKLF